MSNVPDLIRKALVVFALILVPFAALELFIRDRLFDYTSYTNSDALDRVIADFQAKPAEEWRIVFLGDSEVRWGVDPAEIEAAFGDIGVEAAAMNFAVDGFSSGWMLLLAEVMELRARMPNLKVVAYGVQMVETHNLSSPDRVCENLDQAGAFQYSVFKSAFARDWDLLAHCRRRSDLAAWTVRKAENAFAFVRFRRELRSLVFGRAADAAVVSGLQSTALPTSYNGYQPHIPAKDNKTYEQDKQRRYEALRPDGAAPPKLSDGAWEKLVEPDGYFDSLRAPFEAEGIEVVFFALPTNPWLIDAKDRREDYQRNSEMLKEYAARTGVTFIDLGIKDEYDPLLDFSDFRHLSQSGAEKFSAELGGAMASSEALAESFSLE